MDILNPEQVWIENRCYRLLPIKEDKSKKEKKHKPFARQILDEDEEYDLELPIMHHGNRFHIDIYIPEPLKKHITGKYQRMKQALEKYGASITVPPPQNKNAPITITGASKKIVSDTYRRIQDIANTNRLKEDFTHFISIPINSPEIQHSFLQFKEDVLSEFKNVRGINESIFQNPKKLHLTITTLVLLDERDKQKAEAILMKCGEKFQKYFENKEFVVEIKGIEYMNDDPSEVDVLYAKLQEKDEDNILQLISDDIMRAFIKENLSKDMYDKVKLHITLMNTLFRDNTDSDSEKRITFNAKPILERFKDYDFGQIIVSEIHMSVRHTTVLDNGYYVAGCKFKLNS